MPRRIFLCGTILIFTTLELHLECSGQEPARLIVSGDGKRVLAGTRVFDTASQRQISNLDSNKPNAWGSGGATFGFARGISFDGSIVVLSRKFGYGGVDCVTRWFDVNESRRFRADVSFSIVRFSNNNRWILLYRPDQGMIILDNSNATNPEPHFTSSTVNGMACLNSDGKRIAFSCPGKKDDFQHLVTLMEIQSRKTLRTFKLKSAGQNSQCHLEFGPEGRFLLAHDAYFFAVFDLNVAGLEPVISGAPENGQFWTAKLIVAENSIKTLAYEVNGKVRVWSQDAEQPKLLATLVGWNGTLTVNSTGSRALISRVPKEASSEKHKEIVLMDLNSETNIKTFWESSRPSYDTFAHAFSTNGKWFYGYSESVGLQVFDSNDGDIKSDN